MSDDLYGVPPEDRYECVVCENTGVIGDEQLCVSCNEYMCEDCTFHDPVSEDQTDTVCQCCVDNFDEAEWMRQDMWREL